jgi:hypothetical protein
MARAEGSLAQVGELSLEIVYAPVLGLEGHATPAEGRRRAWVASATAGGVVCQQLGGVVVHDVARDLLGKLERVELGQ